MTTSILSGKTARRRPQSLSARRQHMDRLHLDSTQDAEQEMQVIHDKADELLNMMNPVMTSKGKI